MSEAPPGLAALYASERAAGGASDADRERIRGAVLASVGVTIAAGASTTAGAATTAGTAAAGGIAGKLVILLVTLGAIGGGAALIAHGAGNDAAAPTVSSEPPSSREPYPSLVARTEPSVSLPSTSPPAPTSSLPPASSKPPASRSRTLRSLESGATSTQPSAAPSESDVQRLARAVALSARGDAAGALALLDGVASTSAVVEERDALRVITFAKLGRTDEACAAAAVFVARHPYSIHRAAVEEVPCSSAR